MRKSNFALRLQPSLLDEARRTADEEGVALNQLINVAVAEKLSAIRTESFFRERARRANIPEAIEILNRMGKGNPPLEGDELPESERLYALGSGRRGRARQTGARKTRAMSKKA
jgi:HicB family